MGFQRHTCGGSGYQAKRQRQGGGQIPLSFESVFSLVFCLGGVC